MTGGPTPGASFESRLKAQALGIGFDLAGITTLGPAVSAPVFERWLAADRHGEMDYLRRGAGLRADTTRPEPGMLSALVVALDYGGRQPAGPIARYARGDDYHRVMWDRLDELLAWVRAERGATVRGRAYVDTGPILERDLARRAGLGWFGKNTMLIHPRMGSFFFIGSLFLELDLAADSPFAEEHCGTCTRCLDACPTQAFVEPGVMDARRCISYLTIESRAALPAEFHEAIGTHLYGCDVCQDVCPWNVRFAKSPPSEGPLAPRPEFAVTDGAADRATDRADDDAADPATATAALARTILAMDETEYRDRFRGSAMKRAKLAGLQRNAAVVLGNTGRSS